MLEPTIEQMTREVAEWLGKYPKPYEVKEWYDGENFQWTTIDPEDGTTPSIRTIRQDPPDYVSPTGRVLLLKEMMQNRDCEVFLTKLVMNGYELANYMTDDTGKLLKVVWEYLRRV